MDSDYLIDCNRQSLKEIFFNSLAENESPFVGFNQLISFFINMKVYPEFISLNEIKKLISGIVKKNVSEDKAAEINYLQFEKILKGVAESCFPAGGSLRQFINHIKGPCQNIYSQALMTVAPIQTVYETRALKIPSTTRNKDTTVTRNKDFSITHRKILNTSASQKASKLEILKTPKEKTFINLKLLKRKSPQNQIAGQKSQNENKEEMIFKAYKSFKNTHKAIMKSSNSKRIVAGFVERILENKMRINWIFSVSFQIWKIKALMRLNY